MPPTPLPRYEIVFDTWTPKIRYYTMESAERQLVHELKKDPTARIVVHPLGEFSEKVTKEMNS